MKLQPILNEILSVGSKERIHISKEPVTGIIDTTDKIHTYHDANYILAKPTGFWFGFGDEWIDFVKNEMKSFAERLAHTYKVYVNPSKVYSINSREKLEDFCDEFLEYTQLNDVREMYPDWRKVAEKYSGIEIPVYADLGFRDLKDENRTRYYWLYTWDISSGCVWRPDGVVRLKEMGSGETILTPTDNFKNLRNSLSYYKDYLDNYMSDYEGEDKEEKIEKIRQNIEAIKKEMNRFVEYDKDYEFGSFTSE
jgi:hypothetical protein